MDDLKSVLTGNSKILVTYQAYCDGKFVSNATVKGLVSELSNKILFIDTGGSIAAIDLLDIKEISLAED
jgi:hypothetical protein